MEMKQRHGSIYSHLQPMEFLSFFQDFDSSQTRSNGFDAKKVSSGLASMIKTELDIVLEIL